MTQKMHFRIHPLLMVILFWIFFYGDVALYSMLLASLFIHEAGHILAAYLCKVSIKSCIILPYGAEITFSDEHNIQPNHLLYIAIAGPLATLVFAFLCYFLPDIYSDILLQIQFYLFFFNILPIWSLDGGRIVYAMILLLCPSKKLYELYVVFSFLLASILLIVTAVNYSKYFSLFVLSSFLWLQVWKEWKYRRYRGAFEKYVLQRLT